MFDVLGEHNTELTAVTPLSFLYRVDEIRLSKPFTLPPPAPVSLCPLETDLKKHTKG